MRFVEEEHQLWFLGIANLGQSLEELGQHPKQKGCVEFRCVDEFVGSKNVDDAPSFRVRLHHIVEIERRFAKEVITALLFSANNARWMAPMLAAETLPYWVLN